jgi:hypothetical protein
VYADVVQAANALERAARSTQAAADEVSDWDASAPADGS